MLEIRSRVGEQFWEKFPPSLGAVAYPHLREFG